MDHRDELTPAPEDYVFARPGEVHAIYLSDGGSAELDPTGVQGTFEVQWYDPRFGGELRDGTAPAQDWAVLVRRVSGR
jgi:hypothetical protein